MGISAILPEAALPLSPDVVFAGCVFLLAGFVKGTIGLGLPTVSVGLLGLVMSPIAAASLLVLPNFVTNVWQLAAGPALRGLLARLAPLMVGIAVGTLAGAPLMSNHDSGWSTFGLGAALILYATIGLTGIELAVPRVRERSLSLLVGLATGVITTVTGVFVVPAVPYLQALSLDKDELIQALGLSFLVSTVALALVLAGTGLFQANVAGGSLLAVVPALVGMYVGSRVRASISPRLFKLSFFLGLLALGAHLAIRSHSAAV